MPVDIGSLSGLIPYKVEQALRLLAAATNAFEQQIVALAAQPSPALTLDQIRAALQSSGSTPLNIFQLLGGPSTGTVLTGTHAERLAENVTLLEPGTVFYELDRTAWYVTVNELWVFAGNMPLRGTIDPTVADEKPTDLTAADAGFIFDSTDFFRLYRWTGAGWEDAPGQPARGSTAIVWAVGGVAFLSPTKGYEICDGAATRISTSAGSAAAFTKPTANQIFLRFVTGVPGGTGGAATDVTTAPSATVEVQSGTGTDVATDDHTHVADILPPYQDVQAWIRL